MIRFEVLLPLFYNDGRPIEAERFLATDDDLVQAFGATSTNRSQCVDIGNTRVLSIPINSSESESMLRRHPKTGIRCVL